MPRKAKSTPKKQANTPEDPTPGPSKKSGRKTHLNKPKRLHTVCKHAILKDYFNGWLAILCRNPFRHIQYSKLVYVDGFAGSGSYPDNEGDLEIKYTDDVFGSPAIMYREALNHKNLPEEKDCPWIYLIFIEKDGNTANKLFAKITALKEQYSQARNAAKVKFLVIKGAFKEAMEWILSEKFAFPVNWAEGIQSLVAEKIWGKGQNAEYPFISGSTPLLTFIDPFGYNGATMPLPLMKKIRETTSKADLVINVMTGYIQRFRLIAKREESLNLLVGLDQTDNTWKSLLAHLEPNEFVEPFLDFYSKRLKETSAWESWSERFKLRNEWNRLEYHLLFICSHEKAFKHMKSSMGKYTQRAADLELEFSAYVDVRNAEPSTVPIEKVEEIILQRFLGYGQVFGKQISDFLDYHIQAIYQKFRVQLKKSEVLRKYEMKSSTKFDEILYDFSTNLENEDVIENVDDVDSDESIEEPPTPIKTPKKKLPATPGSSAIKRKLGSGQKQITDWLTPSPKQNTSHEEEKAETNSPEKKVKRNLSEM